MKQLYAISSFLCLAALLAASCTTSLTDEPDTTARAIAFSTPQAGTRAAVTSSADMRNFSVWGWYGEDGANSHNVFDGETVSRSDNSWGYTDGTRYWIPGKMYNFYAVYPADLKASVDASGTITVNDFDCSKTGSEAVDLMTATATGLLGSNAQTVGLKFNHELAKVKFIVVSEGDVITLSDAKLYGISHTGSLDGSDWSPGSASSVDNPSFQTAELTINDTSEYPLFGGDLLLIPHNSLDGATLTFVYHYSGETKTHSVSSVLNAVGTVIAWEAGQSYNYRISIPRNAVDVKLEVTVNNWEEENYTVEW